MDISICELSHRIYYKTRMAGYRATNLLARLRSTRQGSTAAENNTLAGTKSSANTLSNPPSFSPRLIFSQILALQSLHYLCLSILIQINHTIFGTTITVDRIFAAHFINPWPDIGAVLLSHIVGAYLLMIIVEKSKKCLDFATTLFFIHFLFCCFYDGFPLVMDWWIVHVLGTIILTLLGEYLCSKRELQDIPLL